MGFLDDIADEFDNLAPDLGSPLSHLDPTGPEDSDTGVESPRLAFAEAPGDWTDDPLAVAGDLIDLAIDSADLPRVELKDGHLELDVMFGGVDAHLSADRNGYELRTDTLGVGVDAGATFGQEMHVGVHGGGETSGIQVDIPQVHGWHGQVVEDLTHGGLPDFTADAVDVEPVADPGGDPFLTVVDEVAAEPAASYDDFSSDV